VTRDRDRFRAVVNAIKKHVFYNTRGISWLAEDLLAPEEGLFTMEFRYF
jgi:hypothetical protein